MCVGTPLLSEVCLDVKKEFQKRGAEIEGKNMERTEGVCQRIINTTITRHERNGQNVTEY